MKVTDLVASEYNPYYKTYIELASSRPLIDGLQGGLEETVDFFESIPIDKLDFRYAKGKWTVKEILRHIIDTERIFAYRALRFARNDITELPGFEQDNYVIPSEVNNLSLKNLLDEYRSNRMSTITMLTNFNGEMLKKIGIASDNPMSARAAGFVIVGHEKHHCNIIKLRYL